MTATHAAAPPVPLDLRRQDATSQLDRVEAALGVVLNREAMVVKRRSIGLPTTRGTWVRVEARPYARIRAEQQSWDGTEAAALMDGVSKPSWLAAASWNDTDQQLMWRADETSLVAAPPVRSAGLITEVPQLENSWWTTLASSLEALASHATTRIATPDTLPITQARITKSIESVFPGRIDSRISTWTTAHADLNWANLTAPTCVILDWEDWGRAPRGLDAANLWFNSLSLPDLADMVAGHLEADLTSRDGALCALFLCCQHIEHDPDVNDGLTPAARHAAENLLVALEAFGTDQ